MGNTATGAASSISGGAGSIAEGAYSVIGGGEANLASGEFASVSGGEFITQSTTTGWSGGSQGSTTYSGNFSSP